MGLVWMGLVWMGLILMGLVWVGGAGRRRSGGLRRSACSARYSPRASSQRFPHVLRRSAIHRSAECSVAGAIWQVRTRPTFSERTRPHHYQHLHVLDDGGERHREGPGQLADRGRSPAEPLDHQAPARVGHAWNAGSSNHW